jgi:UDP-N-acetylmuramyl pentapeptide synthase
MPGFLNMYSWQFAPVLVYMLQNVEYRPGAYLRWFWRTQDFSSQAMMRHRILQSTLPARLLLLMLRAGMALQLSLGLALIIQWFWQAQPAGWQIGLALILSYPIIWAHLIVLPLLVGRWLVIIPRQQQHIRRAEKVFAHHAGLRVAVVGGYGKTTMKELLQTVLSEGHQRVAVTPANKNGSISHARFAQNLDGGEEVLILEYGEGRPGDIRRFARRTHPTHAVITGLALARLGRYHTLKAVAKDIFSVVRFVPENQVYVNVESAEVQPFISETMRRYDGHGALGWKVSGVRITASGTTFSLKKGKQKLRLSSGLLGRHSVGPLALAAAFALELGMTPAQVEKGVAKTRPYEHHMQPRDLHGALIIDDTYNGSLEGIRAGTVLLAELPARRKWYITPGLVDQGIDTAVIHRQVGSLIAAAKPDIVVLMANLVQQYIWEGLQSAGFRGEIRIETEPLEFYANLPLFVAAGDVVLMQNDWTDNYA